MLAIALLAGTTEAQAGGFGLLGTAGFHGERAYYYDAQGVRQGIDLQMRPNYGGGAEALLGDRDDKVQGFGRFYYMSDAQATKPDTGDTKDALHPPYAQQSPRQYGVGLLGIQWSILGDPTEFQLVLGTAVGTGFVSPDNLEFALLEVTPGVTYGLSETLQIYANVGAAARYRKYLTIGGNSYAGIRYMFD